MILVLTYHKVLRGPETEPDFYTVKAEHLDRQLELLAGEGFHALAPEELLKGKSETKRPYVLCFDDATLDHYDVVLPLLARHKARGIFFIPTSKLNRAGYVNTAQLAEMARAGHTLGFHSHEHRRLDLFGEEDVRVQLELSRDIVAEALGTKPLFFAPPGGYINRAVRKLAREAGAKIIRTMRWGYNWHADPVSLECIPLNRYLSEWEFRQILKLRAASVIPYTAKQIVKKIIPVRAYEQVRRRVFGLKGRK